MIRAFPLRLSLLLPGLLSPLPATAQDGLPPATPPAVTSPAVTADPLADYVVYGCRQGTAALTPYVFRRGPDGDLATVTGPGTGDVTDGGRIVQVTEPEPGTLLVSRGATTLRFTDSQMTVLGPTGSSETTACLRIDTAFLAALGAIADDGLATGRVSDEIAALQAEHLQRQTRAAEEAAEAARATEARAAERARRQPTVETWHIGGGTGAPAAPPAPSWNEADLMTAYILSNRRLLQDAPMDGRLRHDLDRLYDRLTDDFDRHGRRWPRD